MAGIQEFQQPANIIGSVNLSAPVPSIGHIPSVGDFGALLSLKNSEGTWDPWQNNGQGILLASANRTATSSGVLQVNYNARGVMVYLKVTAASGIGGLRVRIAGMPIDTLHAVYLNNDPAPVVAIGTYVYVIYPSITGVNGGITQTSNGVLPRNWYIDVFANDPSSYTYDLTFSTIL